MAKTKSIQPQTLPKGDSKSHMSKLRTRETLSTLGPTAKKVDGGSGSDSEGGDGDEDDVDEATMKRIMELLGDDGLDEFAQHQLGMLGGQASEEEDDKTESEKGGSGVQEDSGSENEASVNLSNEGEDIDEDEDEDDGDDGDVAVTQGALDAEVDLEDLSEVDEDAVPRQRLEHMDGVSFSFLWASSGAYTLIQDALERIRENIKLDPDLPWAETLVVTYPEAIEVDVNDDLKRELALWVVVPFSLVIPLIYFTATNKLCILPMKLDPLRSNTRYHSLDQPTTLQRWSNPIHIWREYDNDYSTRPPISRRVSRPSDNVRARSSASKSNKRSSRSGYRARRRWRRG
jgi:Eukaryotic rRNA processing protein EBP2